MGNTIGTIKGTFVLDANSAIKTMSTIEEKLKSLKGAIGKGINPGFANLNKDLSKSGKLLDNYTKSAGLSQKEMLKLANTSGLSLKGQTEMIAKLKTLGNDLSSGSIGLAQYRKGLQFVGSEYGLTYKKGQLYAKGIDDVTKATKEKTVIDKVNTKEMTKQKTLSQEIINKNKLFNKQQILTATNSTKLQGIEQKLRGEIDGSSQSYNRYRQAMISAAKAMNSTVTPKGFIIDSAQINAAKQAIQNYKTVYDDTSKMTRAGVALTRQQSNALTEATNKVKDISTWERQGIATRSDLNEVSRRYNGTLNETTRASENIRKSYGSLSNVTNSVSRSQRMQNYAMQVAALRYNAVGVAVGSFAGIMGGDLLYSFAYAREQSVRLDQQMQQMFKTMHLGSGALKEFNTALDAYAAKNAKVSKYGVGSTIAQVGKLNNLSVAQMKDMIPVVADMTNMMQLNGRTSEDTMLAINDAFDNQFKRLQEIGVQGKQQLMDMYGYDGKTATSLIAALKRVDEAKGWSDLTANVSTAADAFQILGNALDRIIVPSINMLTPAIVKTSVAIGDGLTTLQSMPPVLQLVATGLGIGAAAFVYMRAQMAWASFTGSEFMSKMSGLDNGMQRTKATLMSAGDVTKMTGTEMSTAASQLAELNYNNGEYGVQLDKTSTKQRQLTKDIGDSNVKVGASQLAWNELTDAQRADMQMAELSNMEYMKLNGTTKKRIDAIQVANQWTRAETMENIYGRDAIMSNAVAQRSLEDTLIANKSAKEADIIATQGETLATTENTTKKELNYFANIQESAANRDSKVAKEASAAASVVDTVATNDNTVKKELGFWATMQMAYANAKNTEATELNTAAVATNSRWDKAAAESKLLFGRAAAFAGTCVAGLTTTLGIALIAVTAITIGIVYLATQTDYFHSATQRANDSITAMQNNLTNLQQKQTDAATAVTNAKAALDKQKEGTPGYIKAMNDLTAAQQAYKDITSKVTEQTTNLTQYQANLAKAQGDLATNSNNATRALIAYQLQTGQITTDQANKEIQDMTDVLNGNYGAVKETTEWVVKLAAAYKTLNDPDAKPHDKIISQGNAIAGGILQGNPVQFTDPITMARAGAQKVMNGLGLGGIADLQGLLGKGGAAYSPPAFPNLADQVKQGYKGTPLSNWISGGLNSLFGNKGTKENYLGGVSYAAEPGYTASDPNDPNNFGSDKKPKKPSIIEDITGKNGVLDFSRWGIKLPDPTKWFKDIKVPTLNDIWKGLNDTFNSIKTTATDTWNWITGGLGTVWTTLTGWWNQLVAWASPSLLWLSGAFTNTWNTISSATQIAWGLIYTYIWTPLSNAWNYVSGVVGNVRSAIGGAWSFITSITSSTWNFVKTHIWNTLVTIWNKVGSVVAQVKNAFNDMKNGLTKAAATIYQVVWTNNLEKVYNGLRKLWNFISSPFSGGSGAPGGGISGGGGGAFGSSNFAGSPSLKGLGKRTQISAHNNVFSGFGNTILNAATNAVRTTGALGDPRYEQAAAGSPDLASGKLITDPYECKKKDECYAGYDFSGKWSKEILDKAGTWAINIYGTAVNIMDAVKSGNLDVFKAVAQHLIGGTAYQYYMGDGKSNAQALADRSFNCYDGAQILVDLAQGLGLPASIGHGLWGGTAHAWAVVNGQNFDTTAYQHGYGWTSPAVSGYAGVSNIPERATRDLNVDIHLHGDVNGIEDWEDAMKQTAKRVIKEELSDDPVIGY